MRKNLEFGTWKKMIDLFISVYAYYEPTGFRKQRRMICLCLYLTAAAHFHDEINSTSVKNKDGTQGNGFSHVKFLHDYEIFMFISLFKESK